MRQRSANGHYLLAYLTISPTTKAGAYRFDVKSSTGSTAFEVALDTPLDPKGRFQGFSPDGDPSGDPSNDSPPELGQPGRSGRAPLIGNIPTSW